MGTVQRLRKLGFRRWYERQLVESHAFLVSAFLGLILVLMSLEMHPGPAALALLGKYLMGFLGAALMMESGRRYLKGILLAEHLAGGATCGQCSAYATFKVVTSGPSRCEDVEYDAAGRKEELWLRVRCSKCGNEWVI